MGSNLKTYDQILPYFTPEARAAVERLVKQGVDRDLAMTLVEMNFPEEKVYALGPPEQD